MEFNLKYYNFMKETHVELEPQDVDFALIERILRMTPEERIMAHDKALELFIDLRNAGREVVRNESIQPS